VAKRVAIMVGSLYGGGMERVAAQLSMMLSDFGLEVYVLVGSFDRRKAYVHKGKIINFQFFSLCSLSSRVKELGSLLYDACRLAQFKIEYGIDCTISFAPEMNFLNMVSGRRDKKILTIHSCQSLRKDFQGICHQKKAFKIYNNAFKVVAVSRWCKQDLIDYYGIRRDKIKVIYNPVDVAECKLSKIRKENIILIVGRMHDVKQQWHIIRAFRKVLDEIPDTKLIIAGTGENNRYLRKLSRKLSIENDVIFKGFVKDVQNLYDQAKLTVFSSASEALPCSVIESISSGVPVIAADCPGGIREIIAPGDLFDDVIKECTTVKCGMLVPKVDGKKYGAEEPLTKAETEMAKGIIFLLKNESAREKLVQNCLKYRELFDEKRIAKKWRELLGEVV
jgi:glycosyltransferase involved in cell wall biosynthesis